MSEAVVTRRAQQLADQFEAAPRRARIEPLVRCRCARGYGRRARPPRGGGLNLAMASTAV